MAVRRIQVCCGMLCTVCSYGMRPLQTELNDWASSPPEGCALEPLQGDNMMHWTISMKGPDSTEWAQSLYEGETFRCGDNILTQVCWHANYLHRVSVRFTDNYPLESPEVVFLPPAPIHPHIYSNGHICLDILYDGRNGGWSPALTISKVIISLRSMLASSTDKVAKRERGRLLPRHCILFHRSDQRATMSMWRVWGTDRPRRQIGCLRTTTCDALSVECLPCP